MADSDRERGEGSGVRRVKLNQSRGQNLKPRLRRDPNM